MNSEVRDHVESVLSKNYVFCGGGFVVIVFRVLE
jgi:hypothetical protein